jgi:hypothetical protein
MSAGAAGGPTANAVRRATGGGTREHRRYSSLANPPARGPALFSAGYTAVRRELGLPVHVGLFLHPQVSVAARRFEPLGLRLKRRTLGRGGIREWRSQAPPIVRMQSPVARPAAPGTGG